jgi:DNA modification methylase
MNKIICKDVIEGLKEIDRETVSLIITSPPYNVNASEWEYDKIEDNMPYNDYIKWLSSVFSECYNVLRSGGRVIINIDAMTNRQEDKQESYIRDIRTDLTLELRKIGYKFFGEHIWYKSNKDPSFNGGQFNGKKTSWGSYCSPSTPAVRRNHEYILVFSKNNFKMEKNGESGDPDITDKEFQNYIASTWSMQPETNKRGHVCPFPEELVYRCIKLYSYPNDLILDPFNGSGTTTCVAFKTGRRYIGIDNSEKYCNSARDRILASKDIL